MDLLELSEEILDKTDKGKYDQLEIFISRETATTAEIEKGSLKKCEKLFDMGFSARAVKEKSVGFAHSSSLKEDDIREVIDQALKLTKVMTPDPEFQSLPEAEEYPRVVKKADNAIDSIAVEDAIEMATLAMDSAKIDQRIYSINVSVDIVSVEIAIANSLGVLAKDKDSFIGASGNVVSKDENEMASGFESQDARTIKEVDFGWIGGEAARQSIKLLGARKTGSGEYPVVFGPRATASIISSGVASACNAENIQKKRSYLSNRFGESVANNEITVTDNGTLQNGIATSRFDGEGAPRTVTRIIDKGVLTSYLHDSYTAKKDGVKNTGNAVRGGGWDYRAVPSIGHTNLVITSGKGDAEDFVSEVKEGVLLLYSGDRPNLATGELSAQVTMGFKIEKGELAYPLKQATVGTNLIELLQNLDRIGEDARQISGVIAPSTRVSKAMISGGI